MKKLIFIGTDGWDRPVYRDDTGHLWKDVFLGRGTPYLHNAVNNDFDGEPDSPIKDEFEIIKAEGFNMTCINGYKLKVLSSAAGYYIGTLEDDKIPMCRISIGYYKTYEEAQEALEQNTFTRRDSVEIAFCSKGQPCFNLYKPLTAVENYLLKGYENE